MPVGAITARYLRVFKSMNPAWFYIHIATQTAACIIGVAGWATGLKHGSESPGIQWEDWQKEKWHFLQSSSRLSTLPRTNGSVGTVINRLGGMASITSSPGVSTGTTGMKLVALANDKHTLEKKASGYAEVVTKLNNAREHALPFKHATAFRGAYETLRLGVSGGKSVTM